MPYIDRDNLIKELSTMYKSPTSAEDFMTVGYDHAIADIVVTVHEQPTADVVKVVHCKDCANWYYFTKRCDEHNFRRDPDWFCADGEQKVAENEH